MPRGPDLLGLEITPDVHHNLIKHKGVRRNARLHHRETPTGIRSSGLHRNTCSDTARRAGSLVATKKTGAKFDVSRSFYKAEFRSVARTRSCTHGHIYAIL